MTTDHTDKMAQIVPERIGIDETFCFECHPGVKCFTQCCRGINIVLTPYDIIRLKKRLGLPSDQFLAIYTEPQVLEKTDLPVVVLKRLDDEAESCPFVRDDGCIVYQDRPTTCRYYPLGVASLNYKEGADGEDFFFFVNEPHCRGFDENNRWTVREWRKDQGVDIHDEINAEWTDLVVRKRSFPPNVRLTEKSKALFFMVSYNLDKFREFVFESSFLKRYEVDEQTLDAIRTDDVALLRFGLRWLRGVLFKMEGLEMTPDAGPPRKDSD